VLERKQLKRQQQQEEVNRHKLVANDILEMIRKHNFRGSSLLTGAETTTLGRESLGPLIA
jgi:L-rhamnose mutarotase